MELNLKATNRYEELIKKYLEENASVLLADKINNGVFIEKNGVRLLNRKTLSGCLEHIKQEARKEAKNGMAMVEDSVVYGWAVHYFEENSIHEKLLNEDGSEYKTTKPQESPKKAKKVEDEEVDKPLVNKPEIKKDKATKPVNPQMSFFDMLG